MATKEFLIIPTGMANKIIDEIDQNSFERWKQNGCVLEIKQRSSIRLVLNGTSTENETQLADEIFPVLKQTQESLPDRYELVFALHIPSQKCGYVIGKEGKTIQKVQDDFGVEIYIDNGRREPLPEGLARVFIRTSDVESMRWARAEIRRLEARSLEFNPFALPWDSKKRMGVDGKRTLSERIKLPPFGHFTTEQQMHFREIQKTSAINWIFDNVTSLSDSSTGRFVSLEGEADLVLGAKKRLAKLITEIEDFQLHTSSVRLSNSPITGRGVYRTTVKVPSPAWRLVIGGGGKTISGLKKRFDVSMRFLGDNFVAYPHFRSLSICGHDETSVQSARRHIEREFVAKNGEFLGQDAVTAKPSGQRQFFSTIDDPKNNIDLVDSNAYGHKTAISGWESDDDSWSAEEPRVCSDFAVNESRAEDQSEEPNSDDEALPTWDNNDNDDAEKEKQQRDVMTEKVENQSEGEGNNVLGQRDDKAWQDEAKRTENVESVVVEEGGEGEEDELFLIIEQKDEKETNDEITAAGDGEGQRGGGDQREECNGIGTTEAERRITSGIGTSCISATSSADFDVDEPMQQLIFQPLDRKELACQLERAKATLLGDEHLFRELARTQALLRAKERECEQLRSEVRRLKWHSSA